MNLTTPPIQSPAAGKLLIAEPYMGDENFERTVILLCEHNANGSFGLVLNQPTQLTLSDVIDDTYSDQKLLIGGPVDRNTLHFVHRLGNQVENAITIGENIQWAGNFDYVKTMLNIGTINADDIRLFVGYSGWGAGQLQREMDRNAWFVADADASLIFDTPVNAIWRATLKKMGGNFRVIANYPTDPRLN